MNVSCNRIDISRQLFNYKRRVRVVSNKLLPNFANTVQTLQKITYHWYMPNVLLIVKKKLFLLKIVNQFAFLTFFL